MKSAYELAMERLEKSSGPGKKLSDEQKDRIADIDKTYDAKIAETRLSYESRIATAEFQEQAALQQELAEKIQTLEEKRERDKEAVWESA